MDSDFYHQRLYPLQDRALQAFSGADTGFYLAGGTAVSRGYLHHRFSDDLDLFVNDDPSFSLWAQRLIDASLGISEFDVQVLQRERRFVRFEIFEADIALKIELIDDVPAHVGDIREDSVLGRIDSAENLLANKVTAVVDRGEPKDLADVWGLCCKLGLSLDDAITHARSKAAGVFPADLARVLMDATPEDWALVRWASGPSQEEFLQGLHTLAEKLILVT